MAFCKKQTHRTRYGEIKCMSNTFSNLTGRSAESFVPPSPPTPHQNFGAHCGPTAWSHLKSALSREDSVGMVAVLREGYRRNRGSILRRGPEIMPHQSVQTGSGNNPAFYRIGNGYFSACSKATAAWSWPFTSMIADINGESCTHPRPTPQCLQGLQRDRFTSQSVTLNYRQG
jgi:hypothetical protein